MRIELKGLIAALIAALVVLGGVFGVSAIVTHANGASETTAQKSSTNISTLSPVAQKLVTTGQTQFTQDCSSCHGSHGQGGFGPSLVNSNLSDAQIAATINDGVKPRMPAFGSQYKGNQVPALTAYIRSLKK